MFSRKVMVGVSRQGTLKLGLLLFCANRQDVPVIFREWTLPSRFNFVSLSSTVRDVTTRPFGPRLITCGTEI
ncbi:unnamed protein product [Schistosoma curassoni]|uniref:Secreted protein n=1 Tax=Schistosoma curassoni TaxID=6186 RepID=A0A183K1D2_9TREM|nr:unnamed protein product [Schistosoma curassoni]